LADGRLDPMRTELKRTIVFYALLSIPIVIWVIFVLPNSVVTFFPNAYLISTAAVQAAVSASPLIAGDISIFGELSPIILAGSIIALLPDSHGRLNVYALAVALVGYLMFLHLSIYFSTGGGAGLISSADFHDIQRARETLLALVSNVRIMIIVVAGAIIGINVKGQKSGGATNVDG
jgi:hypothetical protein